ncbi:MAG TPA: hypothetical protein VNB90_16855 [Cytophagaceae bacterium]|jgi:hypothetical protein|nr:hypothetical protein [Cytophagaceae bacterium]
MKKDSANEINIALTNEELVGLIALYSEKADTVAKEIEELQEKQKLILATLNKLNRQSGKKENAYNADWTWVAKISFVLKSANKPMKAKDISEMIYTLDSEILNDLESKEKYSSTISSTIVQRVDKVYKRIKESEEDGGEYLVGLIEWPDSKFDENNKGSLLWSLKS